MSARLPAETRCLACSAIFARRQADFGAAALKFLPLQNRTASPAGRWGARSRFAVDPDRFRPPVSRHARNVILKRTGGSRHREAQGAG